MANYKHEFWKFDYIPSISLLTVDLIRCAPHVHREIELCYFFEGEGEVICRNTRCRIHSGDHVLFPPRAVHEVYSINQGQPVRLMRLKLSQGFFQCVYPDMVNLDFLDPCPGTNADEPLRRKIESLFLQLARHYYLQEPYFQFECLATTGHLLRCLLENYSWRIVPESARHSLQIREERIDQILTYVSNHYNERITLESIPLKEKLSKSYLSHFIRDQLSMNFQEYVSICRCEGALHLLISEPKRTLTDVALASGFQDTRQMSKAFAGRYGCSPKEYKERLLANTTHKPDVYRPDTRYDELFLKPKAAASYICGFAPQK